MKNILLLLLVVFSHGLHAQQVVSTAGSSMSNASGSISYTIGEGVTRTISKGDNTLTQGFHQTTLTVSMINELKELDFTISVYPNPTTDLVNLIIGKENAVGLWYQVSDLNGKLVAQKELITNHVIIPFQYLKSGLYLLTVRDGNLNLKSFKIIKQ
jgi:hypothetical protein